MMRLPTTTTRIILCLTVLLCQDVGCVAGFASSRKGLGNNLPRGGSSSDGVVTTPTAAAKEPHYATSSSDNNHNNSQPMEKQDSPPPPPQDYYPNNNGYQEPYNNNYNALALANANMISNDNGQTGAGPATAAAGPLASRQSQPALPSARP